MNCLNPLTSYSPRAFYKTDIDVTIVSLCYCTSMNWVTTNIRFSEDLYMELKLEAARKRKSVATLIRDKVKKSKKRVIRDKVDIAAELRELNNLAKNIAKENKGISLSKALIEMRYEQ